MCYRHNIGNLNTYSLPIFCRYYADKKVMSNKEDILSVFRERARILSVYYSTKMSGNKLTIKEVASILNKTQYLTEEMITSAESIIPAQRRTITTKIPDPNPRQRKVLTLFLRTKTIRAKDVCELFDLQPRTGSHLCKQWVEQGFLRVINTSNKTRSYALAHEYEHLTTTKSPLA